MEKTETVTKKWETEEEITHTHGGEGESESTSWRASPFISCIFEIQVSLWLSSLPVEAPSVTQNHRMVALSHYPYSVFPRSSIPPLSCVLPLGLKSYAVCCHSWVKPWAPSGMIPWVFRDISPRKQMQLEGAWFAFLPFLLLTWYNYLVITRWSSRDCFGPWAGPEMEASAWVCSRKVEGAWALMTCRSHFSPGPPLPGLLSYEKMSIMLKLGFFPPVTWC